MKELKVFSHEGKEIKKMNLPKQFLEPVRTDLIKRAVASLQSIKRQRYGAKPGAGMRASATVSKRRRDYRGCYGIGISRVPRKVLSRRGTRMSWVGAFAPGTVSGRRAHPPKSEKKWTKDLNKKERRKAIRSALAATLERELIACRGHVVPESYPFIIDTAIEGINKTKGLIKFLTELGFKEELERTKEKKIRAGKGKLRGRKYKKKKGILLVVSAECGLMKAANNIAGIDIIPIHHINAEFLAPGGVPGRASLFTEKAVEILAKEKLFLS